MLKVEMVATIEMILNLWISNALKEPSAMPMAPARTRPMIQLPPPIQPRRVTVQILHNRGRDREGDVDPAGDQDDQQPTAKMMLTELVLSRSNSVAEREERGRWPATERCRSAAMTRKQRDCSVGMRPGTATHRPPPRSFQRRPLADRIRRRCALAPCAARGRR